MIRRGARLNGAGNHEPPRTLRARHARDGLACGSSGSAWIAAHAPPGRPSGGPGASSLTSRERSAPPARHDAEDAFTNCAESGARAAAELRDFSWSHPGNNPCETCYPLAGSQPAHCQISKQQQFRAAARRDTGARARRRLAAPRGRARATTCRACGYRRWWWQARRTPGPPFPTPCACPRRSRGATSWCSPPEPTLGRSSTRSWWWRFEKFLAQRVDAAMAGAGPGSPLPIGRERPPGRGSRPSRRGTGSSPFLFATSCCERRLRCRSARTALPSASFASSSAASTSGSQPRGPRWRGSGGAVRVEAVLEGAVGDRGSQVRLSTTGLAGEDEAAPLGDEVQACTASGR